RDLAHQGLGLDAVELAAGGDDLGAHGHAALVAQHKRLAPCAGGQGAGSRPECGIALLRAGLLGAAVDILDDEAVVLFRSLQATEIDALCCKRRRGGQRGQGHGGCKREGVQARAAELFVGHEWVFPEWKPCRTWRRGGRRHRSGNPLPVSGSRRTRSGLTLFVRKVTLSDTPLPRKGQHDALGSAMRATRHSSGIPLWKQERRALRPPSGSEHSGFQARGLGHHVPGPRRVEHQLDVGLDHGRDHFQLAAHVVHEDVAHAASGGGQGHAHLDQALAVVAMGDPGLVDQAEIDDVDRDLRIEAGAHLRPHQTLDLGIVGAFFQLQRLRRLLADGVCVLAGDAEQVALDEDRETAAECLGDVAHAAGGQSDLVALGNEHCGAVALQADGFTVAGIHVGARDVPVRVHHSTAARSAILYRPARRSVPCPHPDPGPQRRWHWRWPEASASQPPGSSLPRPLDANAAGWRWSRRWTPRCCCGWAGTAPALPARSGACWPQRWRSPWRTGGSSPPRSGACSAWRPGHQWASSASSTPGCWHEWPTMRSRWPGWRRGWWWPQSQAADRAYRPQRARSTLAAAFPGPVPIPGPIDAGLRVAASSVAAVERLELADQGAGHLRTVAVKHARVIRIEQRVF